MNRAERRLTASVARKDSTHMGREQRRMEGALCTAMLEAISSADAKDFKRRWNIEDATREDLYVMAGTCAGQFTATANAGEGNLMMERLVDLVLIARKIGETVYIGDEEGEDVAPAREATG